jgi:hypothetical protein
MLLVMSIQKKIPLFQVQIIHFTLEKLLEIYTLPLAQGGAVVSQAI